LQSGKTLEADFVFVSVGNKPNVELVERVDSGAITSGLIAVDNYLKVSLPE
jgi:NADPH-dependent 2,4-dienoyl-CoA reductase/sulfur reductase-like enzyme